MCLTEIKVREDFNKGRATGTLWRYKNHLFSSDWLELLIKFLNRCKISNIQINVIQILVFQNSYNVKIYWDSIPDLDP
jgi:hypothetical protein